MDGSDLNFRLSFKVVHRRSNDPIEGATVQMVKLDESRSLQITCDELGEARVGLDAEESLADCDLWISAPGFVTRAIWGGDLVVANSGVIVIRLASAYGLRGRVTEGDSTLPVAGATVFAKPKGVPTSPRTALHSLLGRSSVESCTADEQGVFRFDKLAPGRKYQVFAAGSGFVSTDEFFVTFRPGAIEDHSQSLTIEAWPVHGLLLNFVNGRGEPVSIPGWKNDGLRIADAKGSLEDAKSVPQWLVLAAAGQPELMIERRSRVVVAFASVGQGGARPVVSLEWRDSRTACEQSFELTIPRVYDALESTFLRLSCSDLGPDSPELVLDLRSGSVPLGAIQADTSVFPIGVECLSGEMGTRRYGPLLEYGELRLDGLPLGRSRVVVDSLFEYTGVPEVVGVDVNLSRGENRIRVDLDGLSWLRLSPREFGEAYGGGAGFGIYLMEASDSAIEGFLARNVWFRRAPYFVPLTVSGKYRVKWIGRTDDLGRDVIGDVVVRKGSETELVLDQ